MAAALGFAALAAAAFLSGALIVDDPSEATVVALRVAGIVLLAAHLALVAHRARGPARCCGSASSALAAAEVTLALADDPGIAVDAVRGIGALAIGASLVVASTRAISARIAASAAAILFVVITVLAVALSAVITDNVEDEAIRRYSARAETEAQGADDQAERRPADGDRARHRPQQLQRPRARDRAPR